MSGTTSLLQVRLQKGGALATAGTATLFTDALPIVAGTMLYAESFPGGALGLLRTVAFVALVLGAVAFSRADAMLKPGCPQQLRDDERGGKPHRAQGTEFKPLSIPQPETSVAVGTTPVFTRGLCAKRQRRQ